MAKPQTVTTYATSSYNSHFGSIFLLLVVVFLIWLNRTQKLGQIKSLFRAGPAALLPPFPKVPTGTLPTLPGIPDPVTGKLPDQGANK